MSKDFKHQDFFKNAQKFWAEMKKKTSKLYIFLTLQFPNLPQMFPGIFFSRIFPSIKICQVPNF
jgi:hypothetical protein